MITIWLIVLIFYKDVNSLSSQAESWDDIAPKSIIENNRTLRQKPSRSYTSSPLLPSKDMSETTFPDVIYPTSILDVREPFYYTRSGFDDLLRPFSDDVKNSYKALKSEKEMKLNPKYKQQSIQNMKSSNKTLNAPILQKNNIDNSNIKNFENETNLENVILSFDLLNIKDGDRITNISHNLDNVSLQEIQLPLEMAIRVIQCIQDNITSEEYINTNVISNNGEESLILKVVTKTEIKDNVNMSFEDKDCNLIPNHENSFEWILYEKDKFSDEFNNSIDYDINKISESEFLKVLLNKKTIFNLILDVLQNFNDTDHVFLNGSIITEHSPFQDGQTKEYYDNIVNTTLCEIFIESETETASSSNRCKFSEICDSYADNIEEKSIVRDNTSLEIIPGTRNVFNSSEPSCVLSCVKMNELNEIYSNENNDFNVIEVINDYPEESHVKSSASTITPTFDGFKSNKNPFLVLFHHFPSASISDL